MAALPRIEGQAVVRTPPGPLIHQHEGIADAGKICDDDVANQDLNETQTGPSADLLLLFFDRYDGTLPPQ